MIIGHQWVFSFIQWYRISYFQLIRKHTFRQWEVTNVGQWSNNVFTRQLQQWCPYIVMTCRRVFQRQNDILNFQTIFWNQKYSFLNNISKLICWQFTTNWYCFCQSRPNIDKTVIEFVWNYVLFSSYISIFEFEFCLNLFFSISMYNT